MAAPGAPRHLTHLQAPQTEVDSLNATGNIGEIPKEFRENLGDISEESRRNLDETPLAPRMERMLCERLGAAAGACSVEPAASWGSHAAGVGRTFESGTARLESACAPCCCASQGEIRQLGAVSPIP